MKKKKAISLIVLVITILVLSILATSVIVSLSNTNIIEEASDVVFKTDMANYKEVYETYVANKLLENANFDRTTLNVTFGSEEYEKIFGSVPDKHKEKLEVINGNLVYDTKDENEKNILKDLTIASSKPIISRVVDGVPIPYGFYNVGGTKDTGLVISDSASDENKGVDYTCVGNQFVWIPVDEYEKSGATTSYTIYSGTRIIKLYSSFTNKFEIGGLDTSVNPYQMTGTLNSKYTEPYSSGYATEVDEYYAMMESVQEYGGFYIARFEAGDGSVTSERTAVTEAHTVVSKKGAYVYNYVPWGESMSSIALFTKNGVANVAGAVYLSQHMYDNHASVVSTLCYGVQWDAIMNFVSDASHNISNSSGWGNYSNSSENTGASMNSGSANMNYTTGRNSAWQAKNIYDLAGNFWEWTMEASSYICRVPRGGSYDNDGSNMCASYRNNSYPYSADACTFRPSLYIKVE